MQTRDRLAPRQIAAYNEEDCIATLRAARLAARAARRGARARSGRSRRRSRRSRGRHRRARSSAPRCARRCSTRARSSRRSCSTTTTASASRSGGRSSTGSSRRPSELVEDAESIGRLELAGEPEPDQALARPRFTFPAQEHKLAVGRTSRSTRTARDAGEIVELDREARTLALKRGPTLADVPLPAGADPRPALRHGRAGGRARAHRPLAARRRPPLSGGRVDPPPRAVRRATCRRPTSTR